MTKASSENEGDYNKILLDDFKILEPDDCKNSKIQCHHLARLTKLCIYDLHKKWKMEPFK